MHIIIRSWLAMTCGFMLFHVTIRKRKISGSDIIKLTQLEINRTAIKEKIVEAALSVLPIAVIVLLLCLMVTPMRPDLLLCFLIGAVMLVVGMGLFSLGAEQSMTPIGSKIGTALRWILIVCYTLIFVLAAFTDRDFLCIAFDSGGVTTGPMTVPFILAMGPGVFKVRSDDRAEADSFGLVALCSIGPILSVLLLGFFSSGGSAVVDISAASYEALYSLIILIDIDSCMRQQFFY